MNIDGKIHTGANDKRHTTNSQTTNSTSFKIFLLIEYKNISNIWKIFEKFRECIDNVKEKIICMILLRHSL